MNIESLVENKELLEKIIKFINNNVIAITKYERKLFIDDINDFLNWLFTQKEEVDKDIVFRCKHCGRIFDTPYEIIEHAYNITRMWDIPEEKVEAVINNSLLLSKYQYEIMWHYSVIRTVVTGIEFYYDKDGKVDLDYIPGSEVEITVSEDYNNVVDEYYVCNICGERFEEIEEVIRDYMSHVLHGDV